MGVPVMQRGGVRRTWWRRWVFRGFVALGVLWGPFGALLDAEEDSRRVSGSVRIEVELSRDELLSMATPLAVAERADRFAAMIEFQSMGYPHATGRQVEIDPRVVRELRELNGPEAKFAALSPGDQRLIADAFASGGRSTEGAGDRGAVWLNAVERMPARVLAGAAVCALAFAVRGLVRWRRRRASVDGCPACGYSLEGLTMGRCPECGEAVGK